MLSLDSYLMCFFFAEDVQYLSLWENFVPIVCERHDHVVNKTQQCLDMYIGLHSDQFKKM